MNTWKCLIWLAACGSAGVPGVAMAQRAADPPSDSDIVVTGKGLPLPPGNPAYGSVEIDRDRLTQTASGRVEDALRDVAGFQQFRRSDSRSANPSAQGVTLRALGGNAASRTLVLLDGVPIADPFFGYVPFTALVGDRLAGVRITRGGGVGPFGAGAVAGTIELASAGPRDLSLFQGSAFYGSDNAQEIGGSAASRLGTGFATLSGRFERGDGFYTTPVGQRVAATARSRYRDWSGGVRAVVPVGASTELQVRGLAFGDNRTLRFRGADSVSQGEDASIRLIHRGDWQVDALAYLQARNFANKVISATSFRLTLDQRNTPSTGIGGKIELRPPVGPDHVLRIGGDVRIAEGELFEDAYAASGLVTARRNAGGRSTTAGLFVEEDWTIGPVTLTGGARIDRWTIADGFFREAAPSGNITTVQRFADRHGTEANGRIGLLASLGGGLSLRAAAYTGFRLPTLNELYRPFVVFPITTQANAALTPEHLRGIEGGADWSPATGVSIAVTGFYNRLGDAVANVTIAPNLRQRRNVDAIEARGIELTVNARRGPLSLTASYAFSASTVRASGAAVALDGLAPAQSPRHVASATLAWQQADGPYLAATLRYTGAQYEDDLQTDILPAATTLDLVGSLPIARRVAVVARAENLLDADVVTRNAGGSIDLGTPRRLWIGIRFN